LGRLNPVGHDAKGEGMIEGARRPSRQHISEAMITLGMANSRLKDFYNLWPISQTFEFRRSFLSMPCGAPLNGAERRCRPTCPLV